MISKINFNKSENKIIKLITNELKKNSVVILKNYLSIKEKKIIFKFLKSSFYSRKDIRKSGEFKYLQKDYKRLDVGDSYINQRVSRFLLYTEWNKKNKLLYDQINKIINLRNKIIGVEKKHYEYNFKGYNSNSYKFCDMVRMIQYPTGGGFLSAHNDREYLYPKQMINVLIPFSKKSNKLIKNFPVFEKGGLFYIKKNKRIEIEDVLDVGDLIFHNQKIVHGVASVDPYRKFNIKSFCGRITLNFSIGKFFI